MTDFITVVLDWLYGIWPSYAGAIVLLTLVIMVLLTPLTFKSSRSMMELQKHAPEMRKLQAQYRDDRQRLSEETMKFYKEHNISPFGGCVPLFIQMPVFFTLYSVLQGLTRRVNDVGFDLGWVAGLDAQGVAVAPAPVTEFPFDPAHLDAQTTLYGDLAGESRMDSWGLDLSESLSEALGSGVLHALPYLLLVLVVAATGWIQQKQIQGRSTGEVNPQQQMIAKILPIMLPLFSFALPSGLVLYFAVSNTYRVGQQWWISRKIYGIEGAGLRALLGRMPEPEGETRSAKPAAGGAKGGKGERGKSEGGGKGDGAKASWLDKAAARAGVAADERPAKADLTKGDDAPAPGGKGRPTPKRDAPRGGGRGGGSSSRSRSGSGRGGSSGRSASSPARPASAQPRARKKKR